MDTTEGYVLWIGAFAGGVLIYSAIKGKSPLSFLSSFASGSSTTAAATPATIASAATGGGGARTDLPEAADYTQPLPAGDTGDVSIPTAYQRSPGSYLASTVNT